MYVVYRKIYTCDIKLKKKIPTLCMYISFTQLCLYMVYLTETKHQLKVHGLIKLLVVSLVKLCLLGFSYLPFRCFNKCVQRSSLWLHLYRNCSNFSQITTTAGLLHYETALPLDPSFILLKKNGQLAHSSEKICFLLVLCELFNSCLREDG